MFQQRLERNNIVLNYFVREEMLTNYTITFVSSYLYIGFVALSLNQRIRKTSSGPLAEVTSQGRTPVVPCRPITEAIGTEINKISLNTEAFKIAIILASANGTVRCKTILKQTNSGESDIENSGE